MRSKRCAVQNQGITSSSNKKCQVLKPDLNSRTIGIFLYCYIFIVSCLLGTKTINEKQ